MALTAKQSEDLRNLLGRVQLGEGLGSPSMPCSIAAINIALSGELTDEIPDCMSLVIGKWVIAVQDLMPHGTRNCRQWKELLPLAAGTGRDREKEEARYNLLAGWMWERVLPRVSADKWPTNMKEAWGKTLKERLTLNAIVNAARYTTYCIDADWEDGVWDDSDGLDVIGTLERLIKV